MHCNNVPLHKLFNSQVLFFLKQALLFHNLNLNFTFFRHHHMMSFSFSATNVFALETDFFLCCLFYGKVHITVKYQIRSVTCRLLCVYLHMDE